MGWLGCALAWCARAGPGGTSLKVGAEANLRGQGRPRAGHVGLIARKTGVASSHLQRGPGGRQHRARAGRNADVRPSDAAQGEGSRGRASSRSGARTLPGDDSDSNVVNRDLK